MSESDASSTDGSQDDQANTPKPTVSFEKGTPAGTGPVYGAPDPNYSTPNSSTPNYADPDFTDRRPPFGSASAGGYPPRGDGSGSYGVPPSYAGPAFGGTPYYGGAGPVDPAAPYGRHPVTGEPFSDKQKVTAGLLGILLGGFGAGRFYLNEPGIAVAQIAVTWLTCGIGAIWPLIDGIMMLTGSVRDQYGRPLRD